MWKSRVDKQPPATFWSDLFQHLRNLYPNAPVTRELGKLVVGAGEGGAPVTLRDAWIFEWRNGQNAQDTAKATCSCDGATIIPSPGAGRDLGRRLARPPKGARRGDEYGPEDVREVPELAKLRTTADRLAKKMERVKAVVLRISNAPGRLTASQTQSLDKAMELARQIKAAHDQVTASYSAAAARLSANAKPYLGPQIPAAEPPTRPEPKPAPAKPPKKKPVVKPAPPAKAPPTAADAPRWNPPAGLSKRGLKGAFVVSTEAVPNLDFTNPENHNRTVRVALQHHSVKSLGGAYDLWARFLEENDLGSGNLTPVAGRITLDGQPFARFSYSRRIFEVDPDWKETGRTLDLSGQRSTGGAPAWLTPTDLPTQGMKGQFTVETEAFGDDDSGDFKRLVQLAPPQEHSVGSLGAAQELFRRFAAFNAEHDGHDLPPNAGRIRMAGHPYAKIAADGKIYLVDERWRRTDNEIDIFGRGPQSATPESPATVSPAKATSEALTADDAAAWQSLLKLAEGGKAILLADAQYKLPTIHDVPNAKFLGYGVLTADTDKGLVSFDGGNEMARAGRISYTEVRGDVEGLRLKDGSRYDLAKVIKRLRELAAECVRCKHASQPGKAAGPDRPPIVGSVMIATIEGPRKVPTLWQSGHFAVTYHPTTGPDSPTGPLYNVTHRPSGMSVGASFPSVKAATAAAQWLSTLDANWAEVKPDFSRLPKDFQSTLRWIAELKNVPSLAAIKAKAAKSAATMPAAPQPAGTKPAATKPAATKPAATKPPAKKRDLPAAAPPPPTSPAPGPAAPLTPQDEEELANMFAEATLRDEGGEA